MQQTWLTHSLALASWVAMGVTYLYGRETPANPITWAASASFLVCLLLPESLRPTAVWWHRVVWALSALAGIVAVLLSLSRGSYGLIPWVLALTVAVTGRDWRRRPAQAKRVRHAVTLVASAVVLLALLAAALPRVYREPLARLGQARSEATAMWVASSSPQAMNTSLGARLHLWHMSAQGLGELPLIGYGREGRISWIHELGARSGAVGVQSQDHLHNEILNSAYTYGLLGLLSYACLIAGLGWVVLRGRSEDPTPRRALSGVLWMHVTAGLSFVNLSDPYYASMLSLSVALAWMLAREPSATPPTPQPA